MVYINLVFLIYINLFFFLGSFTVFDLSFKHNNISAKYAAGTMVARYGTRNSCNSYCDWEITKFSRGNGFVNSNGIIIIQSTGLFSITAQLHNKHGNSGKWIRTTILIWDDSYRNWYIMSQRFQLSVANMNINFINQWRSILSNCIS